MRRIAICLLALAAGLLGAAGAAVAPAQGKTRLQAVHLSQGVAGPRASGVKAPPRASGVKAPLGASPRASVSALEAPPPPGSAPESEPSTLPVLGFDACATPSQRAMNAWAASPYRAIGVYIGGVNRGCAQRNLTPTWVGTQVAAGWSLIPTYVGLQSPTSACGSCAMLSAKRATGQGEAAAEDAVADAQEVGIGPGSPIYFDMEAYARTKGSSQATLAFLGAWTAKLHALGYRSGVYSSSASGIADLSAQIGTGYALPDDLWIANWNGQQNTNQAFLPSYAWAPHHRLHQYRGGHDESYGGVTINVDNDYVDGDVFGAAAAAPPPLSVAAVEASGATVRVTVACGRSPETSCPGQILLRTHVRVPVRGARPGSKPAKRDVRIAVAHRSFRLNGGRSHAFLVALDARGRPLLRARGQMKAQLLVAIPGARVTRAVSLSSR